MGNVRISISTELIKNRINYHENKRSHIISYLNKIDKKNEYDINIANGKLEYLNGYIDCLKWLLR